MQGLQWTELQYFLAVHQGGSISAAAQALGVNHTTVLRRLAGLEQALGVRLFERFPTGYVITSAGEELAAQMAGVAEQIDGAARRMSGMDREISGTIRLTSTDTLFRGLLTPYLNEFRARHPKVTLQLVMNNAMLSLTRREADIAVRGSNRPPENLIGRLAGRIRTAPYCSRTMLAAQNAARPWQRYPWIAPDESLAHLEQAKWLAAHVEPGQVVAAIDSLLGMLDCVRSGMGAGMLLCPLADAEPDLVRLADPLPQLDTQIWVLTHPDLKRVARVKALADFLYEKLRGDPRIGDPRIGDPRIDVDQRID
jgi:DNA-binding transcriptional LysR family regulator